MSWRERIAAGQGASSALLLLALLVLLSCGKPAPDDPVIAEIGGEPVPLSEFEGYVRAVSEEDIPLVGGELKSALLEQLIEERLLLRAAADEGIEVSGEELRAVESQIAAVPGWEGGDGLGEPGDPGGVNEGARRDAGPARDPRDLAAHLKLRKLMDDKILKDVEVTDEEIAAHYEENRDYYKRPAAVDISQILVETERQASALLAELGSDRSRFEELARQRSVGPEAAAGGHLGTFRRGELPTTFENEVFALAKGKLSGVVETDFGFHIFRVNASYPAQSLSLKEVEDSIRVDLLREKSDEALTLFMEELKERYPVWVDTEELDFPYLNRNGYDVHPRRESVVSN